MEIFTKSAKESYDFGKSFANNLKGGEIIALTGDLGSGKTTFVQGLASGLGLHQDIVSPTFIIMREYPIEFQNPKSKIQIERLYHVDLYRLDENIPLEIKKIGLTDVWGSENTITVVEWADKARDVIPESAIWINIKKVGEEERKFVISD